MRGNHQLCVAMCLVAAGGLRAQILQLNTDSLTSYKASGASAVQDIRPLHLQRGVGIDGAMRIGSVQGWSLAGNPFGDNAPSTSKIGDVNLATGALGITDVDIALPQPGMAMWIIGRSFGGRQETSAPAHRDSNGYQGYNWSQLSQPEMVYYSDAGNHANDVIYILYGADRFLEFKRKESSSTVYVGQNGTAGVVQYVDPNTGDEGFADYYIYYDQRGVKSYFFGTNATGAAAYQLFAIVDPAGNLAYVGSSASPDAALGGFDASGRITTAYDAAGRRYCYSYSSGTIGGVKRLEQVMVETDAGGGWGGCGTETLVAKVEYAYYTSTDSGKGLAGDLKLVTVTMPQTDSGINQVTRKYYRYYDDVWSNSTGRRGEPHQIKMVLGKEGCRNHDFTADSTLEYGGGGADPEFLTDTDANLKPYSDVFLEYADTSGGSPYKVSSGFFNGECGCSGGNNGTYEFTYSANGSFSPTSSYDTAWKDRVVIKQPDTVYATQYFDECGQPLSRTITNADPSGSPTKTWCTEVVRNSAGQATEIHTPANITAYTHSTGSFTRSSSVGLVHVFGRVSGGTMDGFPESVQYKEGNSGTASFTSWTDYTSRGLVIGAATDYRPMVNSRRSYHTATSTYSTGGTYDATSMTYAWHSGTSSSVLYITLKQATTTNPVVTTGNNGSNAATTTDRFVRKDGTTAFSLAADGIYTYTQFTSGQLIKQIADVKTNGSFASGDDPNTDWGITETGNGFDRTTTYAYDAQGRPDTTTLPTARVMKNYYSVLKDGRGVTVAWPRKTTASGGTYYGPASYNVTNHAGRPEFTGMIAISSSGSTAGLTSWIDETTADPISAVTTGTLARMSTSLYNKPGTKVEESRSYFLIPGSGAGSAGTNYDATTIVYDDMGRKIRTVDPTLTIMRTSYDDLGRVYQSYLGTDDTGYAGSPMAGSANMVKVSQNEYDGGSGGGNSHLTSRTMYVENSTTDQRVTSYIYDFRGRMLQTTNPQAPHTLTKYDNLGRVIATAQYSGTGSITAGSTDPAATGTQTTRVALSKTYYDELGRVYESRRYEIDQSNGAVVQVSSVDQFLSTFTWRDAVGRTIKVQGQQYSKTAYDRIGRMTKTFTLAQDDDSGYTDMDDVAGDIVLEEAQTVYESTDSDNVVMRATISRFHDTAATGALDNNADANTFKLTWSNLYGRAQITAMWYDDLDRVTDSAAYGDYAAGDFDRKPSGTFLTVPTRAQTVLRTTTSYNDDGTVLEVESPGKPSAPSGTTGTKTRYTYDALGRQTKVVNNYDGSVNSGNPSGSSDNQTIKYDYVGGLRTKITADMPSPQTDQETLYIYGVTAGTPSANKVTANNRLRAVKYPDSSNAGTTAAYIDGTSDADVVSYAYNAQGQQTSVKDQAGTTIETVYDTAGREVHRKATALGSGIDSAVLRISTAYLARGLVDTVTQYNNATPGSGSVTDQVQYAYDDWGNLATFTQDVDSAIGGSGRASFAVSYTYEKSTAGRQCLRRTGMSSPGGSDLSYTYGAGSGYGSSSGIDDGVSRVQFVYNGAVMVAKYFYIGQGMVVYQELPEPNLYVQTHGTSGSYPSLDRFNRAVHSNWTKGISSPTDFYDTTIAWDKSGVITSITDNIRKDSIGGNNTFDVIYTSDDLGRLVTADEGKISGGSITNRKREEEWGLSQTGNWDTHKLDVNGDLDYADSGELNESGTFNTVNEQTVRNGTSTAYDAAGNLTDDAKDYTYIYDAFGRLKQVKTRGGSPVLKAEYTYNGLNFRIGWHYDANASGTVDGSDPWFYFCHDEFWRQVSTFRGTDSDPKERFINHNAGLDGNGGSSYIDDVISVDRDENTAWTSAADGALEKRRYYCQNWRHDVSLVATDTGKLIESVKSFSYGVAQNIPGGDIDSDGDWDATDSAAITGAYDVTKDVDMDGTVSAADITQANAATGGYYSMPIGTLSVVSSRKGYAGYELDPVLLGTKYHVRNRVLDGETGRWTRRDPLGYVDGMELYGYVSQKPVATTDATGLTCSDPAKYSSGSHSPTKLFSSAPVPFPGSEPIPGSTPLPPNANACCATACERSPSRGWATTVCCSGVAVSCLCTSRLPASFPPWGDVRRWIQGCLTSCEPLHQPNLDCESTSAPIVRPPFLPWRDPICGQVCSECDVNTCFANCTEQTPCPAGQWYTCNEVIAQSRATANAFCRFCDACRTLNGQQ